MKFAQLDVGTYESKDRQEMREIVGLNQQTVTYVTKVSPNGQTVPRREFAEWAARKAGAKKEKKPQ